MTFTPPKPSRIYPSSSADGRRLELSRINSVSQVDDGFIRGRNPPAASPTAVRSLTLSEPSRDARHGLAHFVGRTRIGKTDISVAVNRIEIDARCRGHARLFEHLAGKHCAVGGESRDVGIEVKRAVGRQ